MSAAYNAVMTDGLRVSHAAATFGVPRKTLDDRVKGKVQLGCKHGNQTALTPEDEESLYNYIDYMAGRGFPLTVSQVTLMAMAITKERGGGVFKDGGPSRHWWRGFRHRHPTLSLRRPDPLDRGRAAMTNENTIRTFFNLLKEIYDANDLLKRPQLVFNCDETMVDLNKSSEKVVVPRRQRNAHSVNIASTEHVTALCTVSADGKALPPMIVFKGGFPGGPYSRKGPINAIYAKSESGFVDGELFLEWFRHIFLVHTPSNKPRLLLLDGHASHLGAPLIREAIQNDVTLLCLPPHTTHMLQPLDVAVFRSLKAKISKYVCQGKAIRGDLWVAKKDFSGIFRLAFEEAFTIRNICDGFQTCGISPFNPNAVNKSLLQHSQVTPVQAMEIDLAKEKNCSQPVITDVDKNAAAKVTQEASTPLAESTNSTSTALKENVLVKYGLVSRELVDVLSPPDTMVKTHVNWSKKKNIKTARVLTSEEISAEIFEQHERKLELQKKREEKQKRKDHQEKENQPPTKKRKDPGAKTNDQATKKPPSKNPAEGKEKDEDVCNVCSLATGGNWVQCDLCDGWYHLQCIQLESAPDGDWFCPPCTNQ